MPEALHCPRGPPRDPRSAGLMNIGASSFGLRWHPLWQTKVALVTRDTVPWKRLVQLRAGITRCRRKGFESDILPRIATFVVPDAARDDRPPEETLMSDETKHSAREVPLREEGKTGSLVAFPRTRLPKRPIDNLPLELSSFIGREREVAEVKRLLSERRLLTLCGPGGGRKDAPRSGGCPGCGRRVRGRGVVGGAGPHLRAGSRARGGGTGAGPTRGSGPFADRSPR